MQGYNTIIGAIQMRLNKCPTRSVMDRFRIGSSTLNLIMSRYKALELTIDELEAMSPQNEYSCAVTPQVRQTGNRLSGLVGIAYASLLA